jgi:hypothetical protein
LDSHSIETGVVRRARDASAPYRTTTLYFR